MCGVMHLVMILCLWMQSLEWAHSKYVCKRKVSRYSKRNNNKKLIQKKKIEMKSDKRDMQIIIIIVFAFLVCIQQRKSNKRSSQKLYLCNVSLSVSYCSTSDEVLWAIETFLGVLRAVCRSNVWHYTRFVSHQVKRTEALLLWLIKSFKLLKQPALTL